MLRDGKTPRQAPGAGPAAIRAHYDKGNDFFAAWLDPGMIYSAARWSDDGRAAESLDAAQTRKLDWHLDAAGVAKGTRLLDIGCGWGALLSRAVTGRGVAEAIGLTPAREQVQWINAHHADPRIRVVPTTWQRADLDAPYDAIVSIGALEHFARPGISPAEKHRSYANFFDFCSRNLTAPGRVSLQFIGWMEVPPEQEIRNLPNLLFPDSNLPRLQEVLAASEKQFHVMRLENRPDDYAKTLRVWLSRLQEQRDALIAAHGKGLVRMHTRAFRRFILGFESGALGLYRVSLLRRRAQQETEPTWPRITHTNF